MPQREKQMIIRFDKKFYDLRAIKNTIKAYQGLAELKVKTNRKSIELEAISIDKDIEGIFKDEFSNYVLSEMKKIKSLCL
jgi:hypothetical protein